MESNLQEIADYAVEQPGVTGYICVDNEGLCVAARGDACQSMSGIIHHIADLAMKIEDSSQSKDASNIKENPPVIRVDLERYKITIQTYDSYTTALISKQK